MTNWKTYTIVKVPVPMSGRNNGSFVLDGHLNYRGTTADYIWCVNTYPYNTFKMGDKIEIDNDETEKYNLGEDFNDLRAVRKASSSAVVSSSSSNQQMTTSQFWEIGNRMMDRAERSGGEYEVACLAQQEEQRKDGSVVKQVGWVYRKSK